MFFTLLRRTIWLALVFAGASYAADNSLTSFRATYDLFKNDKLIGESLFQVEALENSLEMQMVSKPGGIYALVTNLQPVTRTILVRRKGDYRLSSVQIYPNSGEPPHELIELDWQRSQLTAHRNNKKYHLKLTEPVYDYLSIHWLAAQMILADARQLNLKFYRKGRLVTSSLVNRRTENLEISGESIEAIVIEQSFEGSSRRLKYHYDRKNPWLPLRIERTRKGKKTTVLQLKSVKPGTKAE